MINVSAYRNPYVRRRLVKLADTFGRVPEPGDVQSAFAYLVTISDKAWDSLCAHGAAAKLAVAQEELEFLQAEAADRAAREADVRRVAEANERREESLRQAYDRWVDSLPSEAEREEKVRQTLNAVAEILEENDMAIEFGHYEGPRVTLDCNGTVQEYEPSGDLSAGIESAVRALSETPDFYQWKGRYRDW